MKVQLRLCLTFSLCSARANLHSIRFLPPCSPAPAYFPPMTSRLFLALLLLPLAARAQDSLPPTHADTLRGSQRPERAWWDVDLLRSARARQPGATAASAATTRITYRVLAPAREMQIDLQVPLEVDSMVQDGQRAHLPPRRQRVLRRRSPRRSRSAIATDDHRLLPRPAARREAPALGRRLHLATRQPRQPLDRDRQRGTRRQRLVAEQGHSGRRAGQPAHRDHRARFDDRRLERPAAQRRRTTPTAPRRTSGSSRSRSTTTTSR